MARRSEADLASEWSTRPALGAWNGPSHALVPKHGSITLLLFSLAWLKVPAQNISITIIGFEVSRDFNKNR